MDEEQFLLTLRDECGLTPGPILVVGFSGGPDSLCLLDMLVRSGYPVVAAHLNHQLRSEAEEEAGQVTALAKMVGAELVFGRAEVRQFCAANHMTIEEGARAIRYGFLYDLARKRQAQAVVVGHTADDQAETVFMHLLRGAGMAGLSGMRYRSQAEGWDAAIPLARPLLNWTRAETVAYCEGRGLQPVEDLSNLDTTYFRNRLRHELLPILEQYNPRIKQNLRRMATVLAADEDLLRDLTENAWQACMLETVGTAVAFSRTRLLEQPLGLLRRLLRRAIRNLRPTLRDIDFANIERGVNFIHNPTQTHQMELQSGLFLLLENDRVILMESGTPLISLDYPQFTSTVEVTLPVPGNFNLGNGWRLTSEVIPMANYGQPLKLDAPFEAWLDAERTGLRIILRTRKRGDRFQPLGMQAGTQKLSDFMVNERLPRSARAAWPLICNQNEIIWLPGYRPSEGCRITGLTQQVLHLRLHPPADAI